MEKRPVNNPLDLNVDHLRCYHNGQPFFPLIQDKGAPVCDSSCAAVVCLKAQPQDDLDWSAAVESAQKLIEQGKWILWEFDFGLGEGTIDLRDQTAFYSYTVAIEEFSSKLWKEFSDKTFGVILYRGDSNWSERIIDVKDRHSEEEGSGCSVALELYSAALLAQYLHRLVSFFPDAALPFVLIDLSGSASLARDALTFSKNRFEHLHFAIRGSQLPIPGLTWETGGSCSGWIGSGEIQPQMIAPPIPTRAVCLPQDRYCDEQFLNSLELLLAHLIESGRPFRLISEERLTEEWNDVDQLIYFPDQTSPQGKRMLKGFFAAGGEFIDADTILSASSAEENKV